MTASDTPEPELVEKLAAIEHRRWADWQRWIHKEVGYKVDGALWIPAKDVERWERQIRTPYAELSEKEKQSDRDQVMRYLPLLLAWRTRSVEAAVKAIGEPMLGDFDVPTPDEYKKMVEVIDWYKDRLATLTKNGEKPE